MLEQETPDELIKRVVYDLDLETGVLGHAMLNELGDALKWDTDKREYVKAHFDRLVATCQDAHARGAFRADTQYREELIGFIGRR